MGAKSRAIGIEYARQQLRKKALEPGILERLSPEDAQVYRTALPISEIDAEVNGRILEAAARVLHPDSLRPLFTFGKQLAVDNMNGIYKFLIRFFTVQGIVEKAAKLWSVYQGAGRARADAEADKRVIILTVEDFPDMPKNARDSTTGYLTGMIELTGAKAVRVDHEESNPKAWRWKATWV